MALRATPRAYGLAHRQERGEVAPVPSGSRTPHELRTLVKQVWGPGSNGHSKNGRTMMEGVEIRVPQFQHPTTLSAQPLLGQNRPSHTWTVCLRANSRPGEETLKWSTKVAESQIHHLSRGDGLSKRQFGKATPHFIPVGPRTCSRPWCGARAGRASSAVLAWLPSLQEGPNRSRHSPAPATCSILARARLVTALQSPPHTAIVRGASYSLVTTQVAVEVLGPGDPGHRRKGRVE